MPVSAPYIFAMSTAQLLKEVKTLSATERDKLLLAVLKIEDQPTKAAKKVKRVKWPDVEARAKRIFGERVIPNLVLLEREEETA